MWRRQWLALVTLLLISMFSSVVVNAQDAGIISLEENKTGTLTQAAPVASFTFNSVQAATIRARVFAITPGFAPALRIVDSSGIVLQIEPNAQNNTAIELPVTAVGVGQYRVEVFSANGQLGDFLLNIAGGENLPPPTPLNVGQIILGDVNPTQGRQAFSFRASDATALVVSLQSDLLLSAPVMTLRDADTGETLAVKGARVRGVQYEIPLGQQNYLVEVTYGGASSPETYQLCLAQATALEVCGITGGATQPPQVVVIPTDIPAPTLAPTFLPPLPASNVCILASATGANVNVRSAPTTNSNVLTQLNGTTIANVVGRLPDNSWYEIDISGLRGWISASVIRLGGPCQNVPAVTPTPQVPPTTLATAILITPTPTFTPVVNSPLTLNFNLPAAFGSTSLTAGFVPDPSSLGVTGGGLVNVSYLGGGCRGSTTAAPTFSVNYTSGAFSLLRFYFVGDRDSTMVVNTASANYLCSDDSFGTVDPTIDVNSPTSGRYDIWIGSFTEGVTVNGTLYITESSANHP